MPETINAKGLACPQPVILTKKALEKHDELTVLVDNTTAVENIKRLAASSGCSIEVSDSADGIFEIRLHRNPADSAQAAGRAICNPCGTSGGPSVFVISSDTMGRGDDALGTILMKAFLHTAIELEQKLDVMIFYNSGVKLAAEGSGALDDLKALEEKGVKMLVCGTCVNFYNLTGKIRAGAVSNMYDIAGTLSKAGRIVQP